MIIDEDCCIVDKGCIVCVEVCLMDLLVIDLMICKVYMVYDECWYCMFCEKDCLIGVVKVEIFYLLC